MLNSEIDDIFSSKGKSKAVPQATSTEPVASKKKKKRQNKTSQARGANSSPAAGNEDGPSRPEKKKRPAPETVVDTSSALSLSARPAKKAKADPSDAPKAKKKEKKLDKGEEERFKDSRGSGPRRKTEEGFSIFKEDELGIRDGGGDTPLCPFDCDCCF